MHTGASANSWREDALIRVLKLLKQLIMHQKSKSLMQEFRLFHLESLLGTKAFCIILLRSKVNFLSEGMNSGRGCHV